VSFAAITLCVASQRVFIVVSVYFVIESVRKLLDTPSYIQIIVSIFSYFITVNSHGFMGLFVSSSHGKVLSNREHKHT
jgi:hypothetical protein